MESEYCKDGRRKEDSIKKASDCILESTGVSTVKPPLKKVFSCLSRNKVKSSQNVK